MSRPGHSLLAAVALLALSGEAAAQTAYESLCPAGQGQTLLRGTVAYQLLGGAITNNATVFGAASLVGNKILPLLADPEAARRTSQQSMSGQPTRDNEGIVVAFELHSAFNVLRVPVCTSDKAETPGPRIAKADLSSFSYGFGGPLNRYVAVFFAASAAIHSVGFEGGAATRATYALGPIAAIGATPVALFKRRFERDDFSMIFDYVGGVQIRTPLGGLTAGYVGSQGVFGNLTEPTTTAFVSSVVNQLGEAAQVPYIELGLHMIGKAFGSETLRNTAMYGRRLQYPSVPQADTEDTKSLAKPLSLTTIHLDQTRLAGFLDFSLAAALQPKPDLYEASLGFRSGNFRAVAGVVKLPSLWYYGIDGGLKPRVSIDFEIPTGPVTTDPSTPEVPRPRLSLAINNPTFLAAFPYAYNAVTFEGVFAGGF